MDTPDPNKAQVLWNKGQNFFASFFAELGDVRRQIGDDAAFARWCLDDLHIPISVINQVAEVLSRVDAAKAKAELATARQAEQERLRREREEREALRAAEIRRKEEEKAATAAEKARREEYERLRQKEEDRKRRAQESKRKNNAGWKAKQREELKTALATITSTNVVPIRNVEITEKSEGQLVKQIKAAIDRCDKSRADWIEASIELAGLLCEARARYPMNERFSKWLDEHEIKLNAEDRAALLKLGQNIEAMRVILDRSESRSYQHIWRETQKQIGSLSGRQR